MYFNLARTYMELNVYLAEEFGLGRRVAQSKRPFICQSALVANRTILFKDSAVVGTALTS